MLSSMTSDINMPTALGVKIMAAYVNLEWWWYGSSNFWRTFEYTNQSQDTHIFCISMNLLYWIKKNIEKGARRKKCLSCPFWDGVWKEMSEMQEIDLLHGFLDSLLAGIWKFPQTDNWQTTGVDHLIHQSMMQTDLIRLGHQPIRTLVWS